MIKMKDLIKEESNVSSNIRRSRMFLDKYAIAHDLIASSDESSKFYSDYYIKQEDFLKYIRDLNK